MNPRVLTIGTLVILCLGLCVGVFVQHGQLFDLRAQEQQQLFPPVASSQPDTEAPAAELSPAPAESSATMSELLRLRNQATQLSARKRELADAQAENEKLRQQLANRPTNNTSGTTLPTGYIRRGEALWVGLSTPENALQSFVWAIQNRDAEHFLKSLTPEGRQKILQQVGNSPNVNLDSIFKDAAGIPGFRVVSQESKPDGSVVLQTEIIPGEPSDGQKIHFRQIDGEWKIDML